MSKEFVWTDALVEEYSRNIVYSQLGYNKPLFQTDIEAFKQSHTPKEDKGLCVVDHNWEIKWLPGDLSKKDNRFVGNGKQCMEFIEKHKPKEDNKDWEVTCATGFTKEGGLKIISVKRLSDNEVFSVGDTLWHGWKKKWVDDGRIVRFEIDGASLYIHGNDWSTILSAAEKSKPKEQPPQREHEVYYSQKKVDELCEKAFNAAKLRNLNPDFNWHTYKTYQDFKKQQ